jgi:hypothetical protein
MKKWVIFFFDPSLPPCTANIVPIVCLECHSIYDGYEHSRKCDLLLSELNCTVIKVIFGSNLMLFRVLRNCAETYDTCVHVYRVLCGKNLPKSSFGRKSSNNKIIMVKKPFFRRYNKVRNTCYDVKPRIVPIFLLVRV